mmetsp:Transcript_9926/g.13270  ORF Transcript_9926/g.13270 Transcript_9926/m.13270 type:complete len:96 (+) Transcript_9926:1761-2048(+)
MQFIDFHISCVSIFDIEGQPEKEFHQELRCFTEFLSSLEIVRCTSAISRGRCLCKRQEMTAESKSGHNTTKSPSDESWLIQSFVSNKPVWFDLPK